MSLQDTMILHAVCPYCGIADHLQIPKQTNEGYANPWHRTYEYTGVLSGTAVQILCTNPTHEKQISFIIGFSQVIFTFELA